MTAIPPHRPARLYGALTPCAALLGALLTSCSPQSATPGVQGPTPTDEKPMPLGATSEERFGGMPGGASSPGAAMAQAAPSAGANQEGYHFDLPDGWSEGGPKPMRDINLVAPGGVECWLTRLGPGAGGLDANVDRWRGQLGVGPASPEELAALPKRAFLGDEALLVDITSPDGALRMIGLMQFLPDRSMFLRMSGPADAVAANLAGFDAVAESLHSGAGHSHDGADGGQAQSQAQGSAPPPAAADAGGGAPGGADGLRWVAPTGWQPLDPDAFRVAWFQLAPGTQCWITTLSGTGGGVEANIARWHSQFGRSAPSSAEVAGLPTERVLERDALWVDLLGQGAADGMIGVLCELQTRTVFVKIQGPSDEVREHVAAFREFCASLALQ